MAARTGLELADPVKLLIAIFLPPVGVAMEVGLGGQFWLNLVLTLCGYVPGIIHAVWIILSR
ncbi:Proteolipid membrane potential modulator [Botrimarina colliarenosi]|uniref:Proteolipid membrane potential modulator n=1 Tax=Botrimarina colliarenosi TaxID=2528001 RepID=A0A5C6AMK8_9BACT|nr:YqaE/Pmp3 family membrane protein [Botrimarina colliarenosi]TWU00641.1 Proteolipid membrane potential modulator [Botrimarina colliarenosi]